MAEVGSQKLKVGIRIVDGGSKLLVVGLFYHGDTENSLIIYLDIFLPPLPIN